MKSRLPYSLKNLLAIWQQQEYEPRLFREWVAAEPRETALTHHIQGLQPEKWTKKNSTDLSYKSIFYSDCYPQNHRHTLEHRTAAPSRKHEQMGGNVACATQIASRPAQRPQSYRRSRKLWENLFKTQRAPCPQQSFFYADDSGQLQHPTGNRPHHYHATPQ